MNYKIAISGSTGYVGSAIRKDLENNNNKVIPLTRHDFHQGVHHLISKLQDVDILINLAGESIKGKWTDNKKQNILSTRIQITRLLVTAINKMDNPPKLFISASSVSIYDDVEVHDEFSFIYGKDFLADVCKFWEKEVFRVEKKNVRTVVLRMGMVLSTKGGVLKQLLPYFRFGFGTVLGDGTQFFPWIHIDDVVGVVNNVIDKGQMVGIYNLVAPQLVRNYTFSLTLSSIVNRPLFIKLPDFILKLFYGESANVLMTGQQVIPHRLIAEQYEFIYPRLKPALIKSIKNK